MPITIQVPDGMFSQEQKAEMFYFLTDTILEINHVKGNALALRHLIGDVVTVPEGMSFAGRKPDPFVNVTMRVPVFSLDTLDKQKEFVTRMTDYIEKEAKGKLARDRIYINMIWGDAFWGVGGEAMTNAELLKTVLHNQPSAAG